jgi:hypothetical protein
MDHCEHEYKTSVGRLETCARCGKVRLQPEKAEEPRKHD